MKIKSLTVGLSKAIFDSWDRTTDIPVDPCFVEIRNELRDLFARVISPENEYSKYQIDLLFGVALKEYLESKDWFNLRVAADIGFWRFLSVSLIPDVVSKRWPTYNSDHFWKKPNRIWLRSIWWFAYLGWTKDKETTIDLLGRYMFDTDTILNMVERTGQKGTHINMYNRILRAYASIDKNIFEKFRRDKDADIFRSVMKINTATILTMEPDLCEDGVDGYVKELYKRIGIEVDL